MFGAPDLPRRQPKRPAGAQRSPGFGDHVDLSGCHIGLIVDINKRGRAVVASRTISGEIVEAAFAVGALTVSSTIPLDFDECIYPDWRKLG